jgi:hypothetical protein
MAPCWGEETLELCRASGLGSARCERSAFFCEQHRVDAVIIAAEVEGGEIIEKQLGGTVMRLKSNANAAYVDWELSQLFPKKDVRIQ